MADVQHLAWPEFHEWLQESIDAMFAGCPELLGVASRPRPVDLDHELVVLVGNSGDEEEQSIGV